MNAADFRKEAELAKHKNERKLAREERVKTLSETLIRKLNQLTDTDMDEKAIRAFQLKLQVPELFSHSPSHGLIRGDADELLPHNGTGRSREPQTRVIWYPPPAHYRRRIHEQREGVSQRLDSDIRAARVLRNVQLRL